MPLPENSNDNRTEVTVTFDNKEEFSCTMFLNLREDVCFQTYVADLMCVVQKDDYIEKYGPLVNSFLSRIDWTVH